jgi:Tol biopolymer transport system component
MSVERASPDRATDPSAAVADTREGLILGTAAYMSPEQARGQTVDKRTDIWAFGCVLYEMLTGRTAFPGETVSDTLAAILEREPDWSLLPADTPGPIRRLLRRCLEKDRKRRLQSAGDARIEIDEAQSEPERDAPVVSSTRRRGDRLAWAAFAAVTLIAVVAVAWNFRPAPSLPEMRLEITTPPTTDPGSLAISPDGQKIVFVATPDGRPQLWLRSLNSTAWPMAGTDDASFPFWSPDSRSVGFFAEGKLKRVDLDGGLVQTLADAIARGGTWSPDGVILFAPTTSGQLFRVPASGGAAVALPPQSAGNFPYFLPGGRQFLFYKPIGSEDTRGIYLGSLDSPVTKRLIAADTAGVYLPPGWLLFMRQGTLMAQGYDPAREELRGDPVTVADRVAFDSSLKTGAFSVSAAGLVMYRTGGGDRRQLTWFDRSGKALGTAGAPDENDLIAPELSPDGRRVMVQRTVQGNTDIWLLDGARTTRFTSDAEIERLPIWSPDGTSILFGSTRKGARDLYQKHLNGADVEEPFLESLMDKAPNSWSRDGHFLLYTNLDPKAGADLWVLRLAQDRKPFIFLSTRFDERAGQFSPDGRWVAYQSNESGPFQIYVRAFPGPGGQSQISTSGGIQTRWRRDGKELYYIAPDGKLMAVPITAKGATLDAGIPVALFQTRIWGGGTNAFNRQQYDVAPDGRFLISVTPEESTNTPLTLLLNWKAKP